MEDHSEVFVGIDASKARHAIAIAQGGRSGEVRYFGEIEANDEAVAKFVRGLAIRHAKLTFCYEAGPTGYGLCRLLQRLGYECLVAAPSLIPRRSGDRVKTNRRDALSLARLLRAGELTPVWTPDEAHEAMRDLVRARSAAVSDLRAKRQQLGGFMLRLSRIYSGKKTWTRAHMNWLMRQKWAHLEQQIVFEEQMQAIREAQGRIDRLERAIEERVPHWSLASRVTALRAFRGVDLVSAVTLLAEVGDLRRFATARDFMGWLGLTPSESSTGDRVRRGSITKSGNSRARRTLIESAWSYRYPAHVGAAKQIRIQAAPPAVRQIAWKAQTRLTGRYRKLIKGGKLSTVAVVAIARELAGFIWAAERACEA